ncbi:hypothetical protein QFZ30_003521 [Arthrobacter pascens]|uniref:hypothetical protein n=1 Tax=Arthrobacter pascens TaxID=1677 RepID=UPI00278E9AFC|nr:hypothetical protein [Arthrobacter pascens]MDQ0680139.1 hypothetical protein [Arthrobacter pascens]
MSRARKVVLGTGALAVGTLVSLACVAVALTFAWGQALTPGAIFVFTLLYGSVPVIFLAFCLGAPLAILLQPVRNQWLHVAAFGSLGCILGAALAAATRMSRGGPDDALFGFTIAAALILGGSVATGRLAVWKLVRTNDGGGGPPPVVPGDQPF